MTLLAIEKSIGAVFFLVATAFLIFLGARGITHPLQSLFAEELREDPHDLLATLLIGFLPQVSRSALLTLALISAAYLVLHVIEATGLWSGQLWVEYLVLVETAAFLPYEVYEIARGATWFRLAIFIMNLLIVYYLARRRLRPNQRIGRIYWQR